MIICSSNKKKSNKKNLENKPDPMVYYGVTMLYVKIQVFGK